jgi:hypothetical protein
VSEQNTVPPASQVEGAPVDEAPIDGAQVDAAPVDGPQVDAAPVDGPRVDEQPGAGKFLPGGLLARLSGLLRGKVLAVVAAVVVVLGFFALRAVLAGDDTADAKAGDCVASVDVPEDGKSGRASGATLVDCRSSDAKFSVIGRVEDKTRAEFESDTGELKICMDAGHRDAEYMYWAAADDGRGYVLCLTKKK